LIFLLQRGDEGFDDHHGREYYLKKAICLLEER
jgi:hypothetical protein